MFGRKRKLDDFSAEIQAHLKLETEHLQERGLSYEEARAVAYRAFGNVAKAQERFYESRRWLWWDHFWQDLRYALRMLRKSPGFTTVAVLTLALGIGANTAIFGLIDSLVLRELPVSHPEQLVRFGAHTPGDDYASVSLPMFQEIMRDQNVFSSAFAFWGGSIINVETNGELSRPTVDAVTGNFFSELGPRPQVGRLLEPADVDLSAARPSQVAVLGYRFWQQHYGGATDVVGKTIKIGDIPFTIIGVTRRGFTGVSADTQDDVVVPLTAEPLVVGNSNGQDALQHRGVLWLNAVGRLKHGVTLAQARAELDSLWPAIRRAVTPVDEAPAARTVFASLQLTVTSGARGGSYLRRQLASPVYLLLAISATVLFLACANLASLMLSRAAARSREFGVRAALGAARTRLARQVLVESMLLSGVGASAGFLTALWASDLLASFLSSQLGYSGAATLNPSPDWRVLGFAASAAILTGVLCGMAPACHATREDPNSVVQQTPRTLGSGTGRLGKGLIVMQIALSLVLLAGAGLFTRTLENLRAVRPGFRISGVLEVRLFPRTLNAFKSFDQATYFQELTDRVSHLPGVISAGFDHGGMGEGFDWTQKVRIHGVDNEAFSSNCDRVMPGFFRTEGLSILRGRTFTWQDDEHSPQVVVVSDNFARLLFPRRDAIGQRIDITTEPEWQNLEIVGIVSNASLYDIRKPPEPTVYVPTLQYASRAGFDRLLVHTTLPPVSVRGPIGRAVNSFGRQYVYELEPLAKFVDESILPERIIALLSSFFGALALLIAAVGLFGLMAYNVTQRTRELGIRFALGAQRGAVLGMVLRDALVLTLIGVALGLPLALASSRLIADMLFDVTPHDPVTLACAVAVLVCIGVVAGCLPARRAMRVDPMVALRHE
jgi:predicted permease